MAVKITKDSSLWDKLKKDLLKNQDTDLRVGWFDTFYDSSNDNLPHAYIASLNEEGGPNNPVRPFIRVGFMGEVKSPEMQNLFKASMKSILEGKTTFTQEYRKIGLVSVQQMKSVMDAWSTPPNSARTIAAKGFNDPLIDTGELRNNVAFEIGKG